MLKLLKYLRLDASHLLVSTVTLVVLVSPPVARGQLLTPGEPSVTAGGAAAYEIKLRVPHGTAGLIPELSLVYNSQGGSPTMGLGWSVTGLSMITRCPQTRAQDGLYWVGGVTLTSEDRYCLDGQRLVAVGDPAIPNSSPGVYGASGTHYATETESFAKVKSEGTTTGGVVPNGGIAYGPVSFSVKTKNGLTMEFGSTTDSRIYAAGTPAAALWALSKVTDTKGNFMAVTYSPNSIGQFYPIRIEYTGNNLVSPPLVPTSKVEFVYEDGVRPDVAPSFVAGAWMRTTVRLKKIQMYSANALAREYRVNYLANPAPPARSLVSSIEECAANGACLPATNFRWTSPTGGWQQPLRLIGVGPFVDTPISSQCISADFTGDGLTDVACYSGGHSRSWHMMIANPHLPQQWDAPYWNGGADPGVPSGGQCITGDFNGDGKSDMACYTGPGGSWHMIFSTGIGWSDGGYWAGPQPGVPVSNQCMTGDFNGDGKTDIACYTGSQGTWHVAFSQGTSWLSFYTNGSGPSPSVPVWQQCFVGEYDGDGRTDIACYTGGDGVWHVVRATGSGFAGGAWASGPHANFAGDRCVTGDFNGDGKTDLACYAGTSGNWHVAFSRGAGGWSSEWWTDGPHVRFPLSDQCRVGDFNGDGKSDLLCHAGSGAWHLAASSGSGWVNSTWAQGPAPGDRIGDQCLTGEFNGDGKTDLVCYAGSRVWQTALTQPTLNGLIDQVSRPLGTIATFSYGTPAAVLGSSYLQSLAVAAPGVVIVPGGPVVTRVVVPDGIGGTRGTSYRYDTAAAEPSTGRGFLGFRRVTRQDEQTGVSTITTYRQDFPFVGQPESVRTTTGAGATLTETTSTFQCREPNGIQVGACASPPQAGRRYLVYSEQSLSKAWDLNGAPMPWSRTTNSSVDAFGNFQNILTETLNPGGAASDFSKSVTNTYYNNPATWVLGRLLRSTVMSSGPTVAAPVVPGSGGLSPPPGPTLPPGSPAAATVLTIIQLLLED